ncbi:ABC transporter ATP-binding protein [Marinoscillum pacificum]|uniref:ABC transporter ATP-binding protein n=1 Tax=Marinoscillum pacificum TaxID=392723 RepID=UPI0021589970|nr:ABC transporter ATP-binding protein [Marinoscillum pacificum]
MLEAINLTKQYGQQVALNGLNLSVGAGEVYCLLGQNGAGKTTTINLFLGLLKPDGGKALIDGVEVGAGNTNELIAYIPEIVQLYGNMTGLENLDFFSRLAGHKHDRAFLSQLLLKAGLKENDHQKKLSSYSKGMRQKVGIAIALSKKAKVIFMDEPTSGLDPKATDEFTKICKELAQDGNSIFMATHDIFNAVNVGTRIGIMKEGNLVHSAETNSVSALELQELYLKTI